MKLKLRKAEDRAARALHKLDEAIATARSNQQEHKKDMVERHKRIDALRKKCARTPRTLMKAIKRAEAKGQIDSGLHLTRRIESKGVYMAEARAVMWELTKAGCVPSKTGKVIQMVARLAGANYTSKLSRRTVLCDGPLSRVGLLQRCSLGMKSRWRKVQYLYNYIVHILVLI